MSGPSAERRVLLVNMPWGCVDEPNIGLGILKRILGRAGVGCDTLYGSMRMLRYLKYETYNTTAGLFCVNDFVWTRIFEDQPSAEQLAVLERVYSDPENMFACRGKAKLDHSRQIATVMRIRQEVAPRFLDDVMAEIDFSQYALVGFTCLFDQTWASLALARRIRRAYPDIMLAFGGYALTAPAGPAFQRSFPEMDVVAYGDGEPVIFPLWEAAMGRRSLDTVPNIAYRDGGGQIVESPVAVKIDLDESPVPDYDDFFLQREEMRDKHKVTIPVRNVPVESSRGCWYGQKNHCTFCGIDDEALKYRVKSAETTIKQLDELNRRYQVTVFRFSDYIMPLRYYKSFLPKMAERGAPYSLHYETKANLTASQVELCARAGMGFFQPGIESFSTHVLRLMAKGVDGAQNVFILYTMACNNIYTYYNLIYGFPFETPDDYRQMLKVVPGLYHIQPPITAVPVQITRYAPLASDPERFGGEGPVRAHWRYGLILSGGALQAYGLDMDDTCYYFESPYPAPGPELRALYDALELQVLRWAERYGSRKAFLSCRETEDGITITDSRYFDVPQVRTFGRTHRVLGEVMRRQVFNLARLVEEMARRGFDEPVVRSALEELIAARVVLEVEREYVWVAIPENRECRRLPTDINEKVLSSDQWPDWSDASDLTEEAPTDLPGRRAPLTVVAVD